MAILAKLEASYSGRSIDLGSATGFRMIADGSSLGHPAERPMYANTFDGEAVLATGAPQEPREVQFPLQVSATTFATLQSQLDSLDRVLSDVTRQGGGVLKYRSSGGSYVTTYNVAAAKRSGASLAEYEAFKRVTIIVSMVVDPYGLTDPLDVTDGFSANSLGTAGLYNLGGSDWTADAGALTNGAVSGGVLDASANLSTQNRFIHTGTPHTLGDVSVQLKHSVGATLTNYVAGVILKRIDASNYIIAYVDDTGAASRIRIDKVVAGVTTNLVSTALTRLTASTAFWIEAKIVGNVVTAEHWTAQPTPMGSDAAQATTTLSGSDATLFGSGVRGRVGIVWTPIETTAYVDDFRVRACSYREVTFPRVLVLDGSWGGTKDAMAGVYYTASGGTAPIAMMYAWWPRVSTHNMVWNSGAESVGTSATVAYGWVATAVSGVIAAATSITRTTTAASIRSGSAAFEVITPATTDTGASILLYRRGGFRKGVTYTAQCYVRAAAGTTAVRVKLGISGDLGTGTASALTTSFAVRTVTWTPAADSDVAYFAIGVNAATATTFQFDDVMVYEGTTAPTCELGGFGPGFVPGASYNLATASIAGGTAWTQTVDANYLVGTGPKASGALSTNGNLDFPILPHLFTPDDYTLDEVDVAVFARVEVASTQTSLACAISMASERGTSYGSRRYGTFRSGGKTLKLPSSGTVFKPYYLGTVTLKVDRSRPRREWLRLSFTNSGAATGTVGVDYLVVVPLRSIASSRRGASDSVVPDFIASTAETTKAIGIAGAREIRGDLSGSIVEHTNGDAHTPDDGIGGEPVRLSPDGAELLVWPSDQVIDLTDSSASGMAKTYSGSVQVAVQPRVHMLRQS